MISFDSVSLKAFLEENKAFLSGARIQKIQQPTRREFIFTLRCNADTKKLYINIEPQFYHICFISKENEQKRLIEIPKKPPMFCMLLRKYLENSRITKVVQPEFERILEFYIETCNELSEKIYLCLAIELMGKHSNVILYNYDTNLILGSAHNVGAEKSREREIRGGVPYVYPPKKSYEWYVSENSFANQNDDRLINERIDDYFAQKIGQDKFSKLKTKYLNKVQKQAEKVNNSISKINSRIIPVADADKYRHFGDLIMANLYNNKDYSEEIDVYDYNQNKNITITLSPLKTLKENANEFYKLYTKSKNSIKKSNELLEKLNAQKDYFAQLLYSIEISESIEDLNSIEFEIEPDRTSKKQEKSTLSPLEISGDDYIIFIGKNNRQNDYIVSKLAKDEDLWFHTHNVAGSHVLLKAKAPDDELILKCAELAKKYSSASTSSKVGVIYTKAKYLKKPPKANLGYVTYFNEHEIIID